MLEQVTIRNFKSIGEVTVRLSPVTVLIGCSGAGKSNFLRALRFLRNYLLVGESAVAAEGGWHRIQPYGLPRPLSISVTFRLPGFDQTFTYTLDWTHERNAMQLNRETLLVSDRALFQWAGRNWTAWVGEGTPPQLAQPSVALGKFPTVTEAVLAFTALTSGMGWHDFAANVLTSLKREPSLFGHVPLPVSGLDDNANNFLDVIRDLTQDLRDQRPRRQILSRLKQINSTVRSIELDSIQKPTQVIVGHEVGGKIIALDLSQESDGFRRYYAHLLAMYQTPPKQVLMFEEPENGVYPGALRNLSEEFAAASVGGRGQVLLSTQSPELLEGFSPEHIRVVDLHPETQQTRIGPLDPDQSEALREQLMHPGELLTVDTPRIAPAGTR